MRKYIIILLFFCGFLSLLSRTSYAYAGCDNYEIIPDGVNSLNYVSYMNGVSYREVNYICSYDFCYKVLEGDMEESISNFSKLYLDGISDEDLLIVNVKGIPITKIVVNNCK